MSGHIENMKVTSCDVVVERGFAICGRICFEGDGTGQCYGGVVLGGMTNTDCACNNHHAQPNLLAEWCAGVFGVCDAESLQGCIGKIVRIKRDDPFGKIISIGHAYKDFWFSGVDKLSGRGEE